METARTRNPDLLAMTHEGGLIRHHTTKLAFIYRLSDAALIILGLLISSHLYDSPWHDRYSFVAAVAVAAFYIFSELNGLYRSWRIASIMQEISRLWVAWSGTLLTLLFVAFVLKTSEEYSRQVIVTWFLLTPALISVWRVVWRTTWRQIRSHGHNSRTVAIIGLTDLGTKLARNIREATWMGLRLTGYYDDRAPAEGRIQNGCENTTLLGDSEALIRQAQNGEIDMIYITLPLRAETRVNEIVKRLSDTTASVYFVPDLNAFDMLHARWYSLGDIPVVSIHETPFYGIDGWVKRAEDLVLGSLIMTLIAIPMLFIALGVKLSSPGPVIFRQKRYGIDGKKIEVWKFRTMTVCEDGDSVTQATKNDSRITPFGGFLRRTSLDELPQFINVLQGKMSIVGPRPHAVAHNEEYRKLIHRYMLRHKVKPGITGWAQINGWRGETDTLDKMEKRIEYDLEYIRHWSLGLDLKIVVATVFYGFVSKNAY